MLLHLASNVFETFLNKAHTHTHKHKHTHKHTHTHTVPPVWQVHASMRGIVSLAKETSRLQLSRDASGAFGCFYRDNLLSSSNRHRRTACNLGLQGLHTTRMYWLRSVPRTAFLALLVTYEARPELGLCRCVCVT
jgi:hypothetical protein